MKNRITILTLLLLAVMISFSGCTDGSTTQKSELATVNSIEEIDAMLENAPVFIELGRGAGLCPSCVEQKPILEELAAKYEGKVHFIYIDVDNQKQLARQFNYLYVIPDMTMIAASDNGKFIYVTNMGTLTSDRREAMVVGPTPKNVLDVIIMDALRLRNTYTGPKKMIDETIPQDTK